MEAFLVLVDKEAVSAIKDQRASKLFNDKAVDCKLNVSPRNTLLSFDLLEEQVDGIQEALFQEITTTLREKVGRQAQPSQYAGLATHALHFSIIS